MYFLSNTFLYLAGMLAQCETDWRACCWSSPHCEETRVNLANRIQYRASVEFARKIVSKFGSNEYLMIQPAAIFRFAFPLFRVVERASIVLVQTKESILNWGPEPSFRMACVWAALVWIKHGRFTIVSLNHSFCYVPLVDFHSAGAFFQTIHLHWIAWADFSYYLLCFIYLFCFFVPFGYS